MDVKAYKIPVVIYLTTFLCLVFSYSLLCHLYLLDSNQQPMTTTLAAQPNQISIDKLAQVHSAELNNDA